MDHKPCHSVKTHLAQGAVKAVAPQGLIQEVQCPLRMAGKLLQNLN